MYIGIPFWQFPVAKRGAFPAGRLVAVSVKFIRQPMHAVHTTVVSRVLRLALRMGVRSWRVFEHRCSRQMRDGSLFFVAAGGSMGDFPARMFESFSILVHDDQNRVVVRRHGCAARFPKSRCSERPQLAGGAGRCGCGSGCRVLTCSSM